MLTPRRPIEPERAAGRRDDLVIAPRQPHEGVGALLGRPEGSRQTVLQSLQDQYVLRKEQAEADAREYLHKAQVFMARGEYGKAVTELTLCLDIVTLSPYSGDWGGLETEARQLLAQAKTAQESADQAARETAQREARDQLRAQEMAGLGTVFTLLSICDTRAPFSWSTIRRRLRALEGLLD